MRHRSRLLILLLCLPLCAAAQSQFSLQWADANGSGQSQSENLSAMARNAQGDVYVAGSYAGVLNLDPGNPLGKVASPLNTTWPFVAKYNDQGQLQWVKAIEAIGEITDAAIGPGQSLLLTGYVDRLSDLDPGPGLAMTGDNQGHTGFLLSLDSDGQLNWRRGFGETSEIQPRAIAVDTVAGSITLTGHFQGNSDFDPSSMGFGFAPASTASDAFVARYDLLGNYAWVKVIAGTVGQRGVDVIASDSGQAIVAFKLYGSADFDPGLGVTTLTAMGAASQKIDYAFCKYDIQGNLVWANLMSGPYEEEFSNLVAGPHGTFWLGGTFQAGAVNLDRFSGIGVYSNGSRSFVAHYDGNGRLIWGSLVGDVGAIFAYALDWDGQEGLLLAGGFIGTCDIDNRPGQALTLQQNFGIDYFVARFDTTMQFEWVAPWADSSFTKAKQVLATPSGGAVSHGTLLGWADADPGSGTAVLDKDLHEGFAISQYTAAGSYAWATTPLQQTGGYEEIRSMGSDSQGNATLLGTFRHPLDLDKGPGVDSIFPRGQQDIFVQQLDAHGAYRWGWSLGQPYEDQPEKLIVDGDGVIHLLVFFRDSIDMDPGPSTAWIVAQRTSTPFSAGSGYAYAQYTPNGNFIRAAKVGYHHKPSALNIFDAGIAPNGSLYLCGAASDSVDLDPGPAQAWLGTGISSEAFWASLDANGQLAWLHSDTTLSGPSYNRLAVGPNGDCYLASDLYAQTDLDPDPVGSFMTGPLDAFTVTRFDLNGDFQAAYLQSVGSWTWYDAINVYGIDVDSSRNLYLIGAATPGWDFDHGAGTVLVSPQGQDSTSTTAFLLSLDLQGNVRDLDGLQSVPALYLRGLDVNPAGVVAVSGTLDRHVQLGTNPLVEIGAAGANTSFCATYAAGAWRSSGTFAGNLGSDIVFQAVHLTDAGDVLIAGNITGACDIDPQGPVRLLDFAGDTDAFWAKFSTCSAATPSYVESQRITCYSDAPFTLSSGTPAGGTYFGAGVSGNVFDPGQAGFGPVRISYQVTDANGCTSTAQDTIYVNLCTDRPEVTPSAAFQLYPNPSTGRLAITATDWQGSHIDLLLHNAWGQQVHQARLREGAAELHLDELPAGVYFVTLSGKAGRKTLRWTKLD
jgi:hypothetical protein